MRIAMLIVVLILLGCSSDSQSGPPSVSETSAARPKLQDRIQFIEHYVTFRRDYLELEYDVVYQNHGGGFVPGPSDWNIKILAVIPENEREKWIPSDATTTSRTPPTWLKSMPGNITTTNITEWYEKDGQVEIGIDRAASIIAYRSRTLPEN